MQLSKKILSYVVVGALGILLENLIASNQLSTNEAARDLHEKKGVLCHIYGGIYSFLLGVLLEWRTVTKLFKKEIKLSPSGLLIPGILILLISFISPIIFMMRFGISLPFPKGNSPSSFIFGPLIHSSIIQKQLSVIAGSIIIKGLSKNPKKKKMLNS